MIGQKTITSFFSPVGKKRNFAEQNDTEEKESKGAKEASVKRTKVERNKRTVVSQSSPTGLAVIESPCLRHAPDGIGESWRKGLSADFGKPYFTQKKGNSTRSIHLVTKFLPGHKCVLFKILVNMFKELAADIEGFRHPGHGDLTGWARQGVLLLNAVLTVRAHQANSHKDKGWEKFTDSVVQWLSSNLDGLVFMLWGSYAQKKGATIDRKRHHVLETVHPSPLSAHRGFFGCQHFSKTNELLRKAGKKPIDWKSL